MQWTDTGIVLNARKHGESAMIAMLLTKAHGRHGGLVRGGAGRRHRGVLQPGNDVSVTWRGRLAEHLGTMTVELNTARAATLMDDPARLAGLSAACALTEAALPEREPHPQLFNGLKILLDAMQGDDDWAAVYVRWELGLLGELGFGLDLTHCAATGATEDLTHVSPRTGRAVSAAAAEPYQERLFALPSFLAGARGGPPANDIETDIRAGLDLTGFFLERHLFPPERGGLPPARLRFVERFSRRNTTSGDIRRS
ncbi:MAG: DNA repair protein RecO [Minwuiales bacterium]|nr:DNA repair protein RecO [Minwuiales bacterium]